MMIITNRKKVTCFTKRRYDADEHGEGGGRCDNIVAASDATGRLSTSKKARYNSNNFIDDGGGGAAAADSSYTVIDHGFTVASY